MREHASSKVGPRSRRPGAVRALAPLAFALGAVLRIDSAEASSLHGRWITHPAAIEADAAHTPVVLQFRRLLLLEHAPARLVVRVSADPRYVLFVNGTRVSSGPSRGDLAHWRYATLDLAPFLQRGSNVIAATVWNDQRVAPLAQISARTAFLLEAESPRQRFIDTGAEWRVRVDASRTVAAPRPQIEAQIARQYYVAGAPETHVGGSASAGAATLDAPATDEVPAVDAVKAGESAPWSLVRDELPPMSYERAEGGRLVRSEGVESTRFPATTVTVPAHSEAALLLDVGAVQAAYPRLLVSGGAGAQVTVRYAEALYGPDLNRLADRAQVQGGAALGLEDTFRPSGRAQESFEPYWWRTWRYAEIRVKTAADPLNLERFERYSTGYPFVTRGRFVSDDAELNRIWQIGWDTVRLDAHETFMDTAYWEQLQYVGDSRIEAFVANAASGDPRLAIQALDAFSASRIDGVPLGAWPSRQPNPIPPFALLWIGMLHDHWMTQPDTAVLRRSLPVVRSVLDWYASHDGPDGLVDETPGWKFIDWRPGLSNRVRGEDTPRNPDPCIITMLQIGALRQAADLERAVGEAHRADDDRSRAHRLATAVQAACWSTERGLYADAPDKQSFSQHANILAVLYDVAPPSEHAAILDRVIARNAGIDPPPGITGTTYYFSFYLVRALEHANAADRYVELLTTWRRLLAQNFTTWPETPDPSRSDSHAWSAHPTADLLRLVAGIQPASPGFATVRIAPHLGALTRLDAAMAHPRGAVEAHYEKRAQKLEVTIGLPARTTGHFEWCGQRRALHAGINRFAVPAAACRKAVGS